MEKSTSSKIKNPQSLRVLMVEDSEDNELLIIRALKKGGYKPVYERVETAAAMKKALQEKQWDIILCDYKMPTFSGKHAIALLKETNIYIPLIIVSGTVGEETAIECMRSSAHDYITKGNLSRLCPAIARELEETKVRNKQQQTDESLRKSEENFRLSLDDFQLGVRMVSAEGKTIYANKAVLDIYGYDSIEEINRAPFKERYTPQSYAGYKIRKGKRERGEFGPSEYEMSIVRKNGEVRHLRAFRKEILWSGVKMAQIVYQDITERKKTEEDLRQSEQRYRTILDEMADAYFEVDLAGNYTFLNDASCRHLGYSREELIGTSFRAQVAKEDIGKVYDTCNKIFRTGKPEEISSYKILRKDKTTGFTKMLVFPLKNQQGEIIGFRGVGQDVTESKRTDEERKQSFERLRKALGATVQSISTIVEMKDPYTAGHQQRVSDLARSIATEMGLSANQRDFIRTASAIHDLGKISIPAEILSKPTKLTDLEFNLIKTHSQSGYDILKDIGFPWPVADVVLQHHERMDGSGYPHGLKGNDIFLEARLMAVADVVEAIASHRPYRPSRGIDFALDEISRNKGILYDAAAVDACLKLFREKGYTLVLKRY